MLRNQIEDTSVKNGFKLIVLTSLSGEEFVKACIGFQGVCAEERHYVCEPVRRLFDRAIEFSQRRRPHIFTHSLCPNIRHDHHPHHCDNHVQCHNHIHCDNHIHCHNHDNDDQGMHQSPHRAGRLPDWAGLLGTLWVDIMMIKMMIMIFLIMMILIRITVSMMIISDSDHLTVWSME